MALQFFYLGCLLMLTVVLHLTWSVAWLNYLKPHSKPSHLVFFAFIASMLVVHSLEVILFAVFYLWRDGFAEFADALYFSMVTYSTVGYGDLLLPKTLRLVGAGESLVGGLMTGWTVAMLLHYLNDRHQKISHQKKDNKP
jgi:hypothetical protein